MEKAFKLSQDSELYKLFFMADDEMQKSNQLATRFFETHGLLELLEKEFHYVFSDHIMISMNDKLQQKFASEIKKDKVHELCCFKVNSSTNKKWVSEVYNKIDIQLLNSRKFWYIKYIMCGSYALWNIGENVYGFLKAEKDFRIPEGATEIKMSEYYKAMEECTE